MLQDKYSEYLDSGLMWVKEYPSHWNLTKVKYEAYVKARVGWHGLKKDDFTDVGPYLVTGSDFKSSIISWKDCYHCDLARYEQDPYIQLQNGDLLLTKDGTIGKIALVQGLGVDEKATLNSGVFVVRPLSNGFTTEFYFWLLESTVFKKFFDYFKTGSTIVHLYQDTFVNFSYASPPLIEQTQIAKFLDHETAQIDTLIEKQQTLIQLLKEKRQAVISHAVTKGLNPDAPMKDSGVEWLGEVPEHWVVGRVGYYGQVLNGSTPSKANLSYWHPKEVAWLSSGEVNQYYIESPTDYISYKALKECSVTLLPVGTLVMGMIGQGKTRGTSAVTKIEATINQNLAAVIPNENLYSNYAHLFFQAAYKELREDARGGNQAALNCEIIRDFKITIPPINEQRTIFIEVNKISDKFDVLMVKAESAIQLMQERRTALISAAVTGKIDVRGWEEAQ